MFLSMGLPIDPSPLIKEFLSLEHIEFCTATRHRSFITLPLIFTSAMSEQTSRLPHSGVMNLAPDDILSKVVAINSGAADRMVWGPILREPNEREVAVFRELIRKIDLLGYMVEDLNRMKEVQEKVNILVTLMRSGWKH